MQNIYCLSGLGADEQIYKKLEISNAKLVHLPWVEHEEHDTLENYAKRMLQTIPEHNPIIMGVSFGGMLAVEMTKLVPVKKTIIISSAKHVGEIPHFGGFVKAIVVSQILPGFFFKMPNKILFEKFGATTEEEKDLLRGILKRSDGRFMSWAMKAVQLWDNKVVPPGIVHIHGSGDKIIPPEHLKADHWIRGGSHMMVYSRAGEIAGYINNELYMQGRVGYKM